MHPDNERIRITRHELRRSCLIDHYFGKRIFISRFLFRGSHCLHVIREVEKEVIGIPVEMLYVGNVYCLLVGINGFDGFCQVFNAGEVYQRNGCRTGSAGQAVPMVEISLGESCQTRFRGKKVGQMCGIDFYQSVGKHFRCRRENVFCFIPQFIRYFHACHIAGFKEDKFEFAARRSQRNGCGKILNGHFLFFVFKNTA